MINKGHFASQLPKYFMARALTSLRGVLNWDYNPIPYTGS